MALGHLRERHHHVEGETADLLPHERVVVVSGGASGIGASCIKRYVDNGDTVYCLDIIEVKSEDFKSKIVDVRKVKEIQSAIAEIIETEGRIDVLIASAGIHHSGTVEDVSEDDYDRVMGVNLKGTFFLVQAVIKYMRVRSSGSIVLIGSDQCLVGKSTSAVYGASKGAIGQLTKSLAVDYGKYNIRVNCICSGTVETPLYHKAVEAYCEKTGAAIKDVHTAEAMEQPLERIGQPAQIADVVMFLSSDGAGFMTGSLVPVDGGYTAK